MVETVFPQTEGFAVARVSGTSRPMCAANASDRLVATYRYLCRRGARKFMRSGLESSDLEQVAAIGLIKASQRYDSTTGTPFEAFAWLMVVGELMHHVRDFERIVRVPRRLRDLERRYDRAHERLTRELGREPSERDIACELGVGSQMIDEVRRVRNATRVGSLDDSAVRTLRAATDADIDDRIVLAGACDELDSLERRVIVGVYVLGMTQLELGRRLGLSPKRISRAHHSALRELQRAYAS